MTRVEFTRNINNLIAAMILDKEKPIMDYCKRSDEEQMRLYLKGASNCDGVNDISSHQLGKAMDIYFVNDTGTGLITPKKGWKYWHDYWVEKGGRPLIYLGPDETRPDYSHFEG